MALAVVILAVSVVSAMPPLPENSKANQVKEPAKDKLTKVVFIRYAQSFQKGKLCNNDGVCDPEEKGWCADCKGEKPPQDDCYKFLTGAKPKWKNVEDYYYSVLELRDSSAFAVATWESVTSEDVFGDGISGNYPWGVYDNKNSVSFGDYPDAGAIGVTAIWYRGKNIYEYDIMLDTDYFPSTSTDLDTVVLHEFGHAAGLNDLYNVTCASEVMYGIYDGIDLDLGAGDTTGIQILYGI